MKMTFTVENNYNTENESDRAEAVTKAVEKMINNKMNDNE